VIVTLRHPHFPPVILEVTLLFSRWPIGSKLIICVVTLLMSVCILAFSSCQGGYAYRELAKSIRVRAYELPLAADLTQKVSSLRVCLSRVRDTRSASTSFPTLENNVAIDRQILRDNFQLALYEVEESLHVYEEQLQNGMTSDPLIGDNTDERLTVELIKESLGKTNRIHRETNWMLDDIAVEELDEELENLDKLVKRLPTFLQQRMHNFAGEVKGRYHTWIMLTWVSSTLAFGLLVLMMVFLYTQVLRPWARLLSDSRIIANGKFDHRVTIETDDEISELGDAMNEMTDRFEEVQNDLERQVRLRTKEVIRNEQLASVGFLAAGVAHEINNPLASIAMCAESLESRLHDIIVEDDELPDDEHNEEVSILRQYLKCIQDEAFRCKHITEGLLDYSRMADVERHSTDLPELIRGVIQMAQHIGSGRGKTIDFHCNEPILVSANSQELKQVILNLISNGLDSVERGGIVTLELATEIGPAQSKQAKLVVTDNGCGMTPEVLNHLFEPFFTRRRDGQGTGLGLAITERIVHDHGGKIEAFSDGPGSGSRFHLTLPLIQHEQEKKIAA